MLEECFECGVKGESHKRCAACKRAMYCSKEHQVGNWPKHKASCREFCAEVKRCKATQHMLFNYYKDDAEVLQAFDDFFNMGFFLSASFQTATGFDSMREANPVAFARVHRRCCHKDQVDESVKAKASSAVHLDDISILSDESKFGAWLNTASEEALESFIAQCVPGRADNQIDYSCRGTSIECMEGISTEDMELYPQPAVLKALLEHLSAKRAQSVAGGSAADKIKQLRAMHKVASALKNHQRALSLALERYALASTKADEMDALYDVIVGEILTGQVDEAVRRGHYMITDKLPREAWQDNLVDWIRFRLITSHAKLKRGDIWGSHEALQETAAVLFKWNGDVLSKGGKACPLRCETLGSSCAPCKLILDYVLFNDNLVFNRIMSKYDKFALTSEECASLEALQGDQGGESLALTEQDLRAMAAYRRALEEL